MAYDGKSEREQNRAQKRAEAAAKRRALGRDTAISQCFATFEGRAFLWWLLEIGKVNTQPFTGRSETTAFACGEMNVGNRILAQLVEVNPEGYLQMLKEHKNERDTIESGPRGNRTEPDANSRTGAYDSESGADSEPESGEYDPDSDA